MNPPVWPGYGLRRIQAAIAGDPELQHIELRIWEGPTERADAIAEEIAKFEPDLVAASLYVWSTPYVCRLLESLRADRPEILTLLGGPSAREALFCLDYYRGAARYVDALCVTEGEDLIRELLRIEPLTREAMRAVAGLAVSDGEQFVATPKRELQQRLDDILSPYQLGLMPHRQAGFLESFRGCPLACQFCEWGVPGGSSRTFSREYLVAEMRAMLDAEIEEFFLLDAGLNLNAKAFRDLAAAEAEVGLFHRKRSFSEVYPSHLGPEQLDFIRNMGEGKVAIGLQGADPANLARLDRRFKLPSFEQMLWQVEEACPLLELHLIHGLPSDTPADFERALEYVWDLPGSVLIFHCLVLPDALMTRGEPGYDMRFDPFDLRITGHAKWPEREMQRSMDRLAERVAAVPGGGHNPYWWFLPNERPRNNAYRPPPEPPQLIPSAQPGGAVGNGLVPLRTKNGLAPGRSEP